MIENEYLDLLNKKNIILKQILNYTKNKTFKVSEDEVDRIEYYLKNREEMFKNLYDIEDKIKISTKNNYDNIKNKEIDNIVKENNLIIRDIIELDKEKNLLMKSIFDLLKKEIKSAKSLSKVNKSYFGTYEGTVGGNFFDSSR